MALAAGTRLGPYETLAAIGAGGMGEVYRARDTRLDRTVAIKVLPEAFAGNAERMARFQREAKLLASLNHPNIATIHGLEEAGAARALVMELVEGPTLADRIAQGAIPVDEALPIAKQICDALEYAHEHGVVHRDLKPANIKVAGDGTVKVLDFGLAKAVEGEASAGNIGDSPTISLMATQAGVILGTAAYMSPEQAKGRPVNRRTDIWAFGCVLFEMLAGKQAFAGDAVTETLAAVLRSDPDWGLLPAATPPHLRVLLHRCLQRDPKQRLRDIGDARLAIEELISGVAPQMAQVTAVAEPLPLWKRALPWGIAAVLGVAGLFGYLHPRGAPAALVEATIPPPAKGGFTAGLLGAAPALSPDGRQLVFSAPGPGGVPYLWLRSLGSMTARRLAGTANALGPFWSPDGKSIGFTASGGLMRMDMNGGTPTPVGRFTPSRGASWGSQGVILFCSNPEAAIGRVSASGGEITAATKISYVNGNTDMWPWFLPDGRHFIYTETWDGSNQTTIYLGTLGTLTAKVIVPRASSNAIYASGQLLYMEGQALLGQPFDLKRLTTTGPAVQVAASVANYGLAALGGFSASANGTLVYQPGVSDAESLNWFDRSGKLLSTVASGPSLQYPELSPNGRRLVVELNGDLWIYDLTKGTRSQFTFDGKSNAAAWSPDGKQIAFASTRGGRRYDLYLKPADGSTQAKLLYAHAGDQFPRSWSPDGKAVIYFDWEPSAGFKVHVLPVEGVRNPRVVGNGTFPSLSPDGRWVVTSGGSLTAFPVPGGVYKIPGEVEFPRWSADGSRIYYVADNGTLMQVSVTTHGSAAEIGAPQKLFGGIMSQPGDPFAVAPDGKRILAITAGAGLATAPLRLIQNWPALLTKGAQ